jgi:hypothetical protein
MPSSLDFSLRSSFVFSGEDQISSLARSPSIFAIASFFPAISKITSYGLGPGLQSGNVFLKF